MSSTTAPGPSATRVGTLMKARRFHSGSKAAIRRLVPPRSMPIVSRPFLSLAADDALSCLIKLYRLYRGILTS